MANYLILNKPQVWNGTGTLTYVVPAGTATKAYNVTFSTTVPEAVAEGSGAGSQKGLGAGTGGGGEGFTQGDQGTGHGGVGQGFGAGNNYQQPPSAPSNQTSFAAVSTGLSVLVKNNGATIFTAGTFTATQSAQQFKYGFQAAASDSITVVLASSTASDNTLNAVRSIISIGEGF